jgi:hypothetical protein
LAQLQDAKSSDPLLDPSFPEGNVTELYKKPIKGCPGDKGQQNRRTPSFSPLELHVQEDKEGTGNGKTDQ